MSIIVVGVDNSLTAEDAARQAADLAAGLGMRLHVVSAAVVRELLVDTAEPAVIDGMAAAKAHLATLQDQLRDDIEITFAVVPGDPAKVLCSEAERLDAEIIVVGSKRAQGLGRLLGSVASDVLKQTPCALYVAKTT